MNISPQKNKKIIIYFLILFTLLQTANQKITDEEIKDICSKADSYVVSFFGTDPQIPQKFQKFEPIQQYRIKDTNILDMILLKKDAVKKYKENKFKTTKILIFLFDVAFLILIIIIIFIFNIHFLLRSYSFKTIEQKLGNLAILLKMAPFAWIHYFISKKEKVTELIKDYNENQLVRLTKNNKITMIVISIIFLIALVILAFVNIITYNKSEKSIYNVSCALLKYIYELENETDKNKYFIGLKKISSFFNYTEKNEKILIKSDSNNYICSYNNTLNLVLEWDNYLNELNERLSINSKNEFNIITYPSDLDYKGSDIENCKTHLYQLLSIYNYHPSTDKTKTLYSINNVLHTNLEIFNDIIKTINNTNKFIMEVKENDEILVKKILNKVKVLIDIYITKFKNKYISNNGNYFIKNDLLKPLMFDIIF